MTELKSIEVHDWGLDSHSNVQILQERAWEKASLHGLESILFGELESIITAGPRSLDLDINKAELPLVRVERGGATTLHSPGQLVIYPILNLKKRKLSPKQYVNALLEVTVTSLEQLGIKAEPSQSSIGVWTEQGKIAFTGVRIREGISMFGLSLNVSNDLELFNQIRPCGLENLKLDAVAYYLPELSPFRVFQIWVSCFFRHNAIRKITREFVSRDLDC